MNQMAKIMANKLILIFIALLYASLSIAKDLDSLEIIQDTASIVIDDSTSYINHQHEDTSSPVNITTSPKTIIKDSIIDSLSVMYFKGDIQNLKFLMN